MPDEFSRFQMLVDTKGLDKLKNSSIAVFGLGGVGSYVVEALARCGVGSLTLIDNDTISVTNINRQLYALHSTIGMNKTEVAKIRVLDINPQCNIRIINDFYLPENADTFFGEGKSLNDFDYIIDAIDTVSAKLDLVERCTKSSVKIISSMGTGNKLNPSMLEVADISKTSVCPLCRVMRVELRRRGINHLKVVYSKEQPLAPIAEFAEESSKRTVPGSSAFVPPTAGMIIASEVIKDLIS